jgi:hypothetical protein
MLFSIFYLVTCLWISTMGHREKQPADLIVTALQLYFQF